MEFFRACICSVHVYITEVHKFPTCSDGARLLGSCEYFAVKEIKLSGNKTLFADEKSYHALIVTEGEAEIKTEDFFKKIKAGEYRIENIKDINSLISILEKGQEKLIKYTYFGSTINFPDLSIMPILLSNLTIAVSELKNTSF